MRYNNQDLIDIEKQMLGKKDFGGCSIGEYHKYLLKILKEIDRICQKNSIRYFLMYGSLIGAVRHYGFIPWDDDADIVMTRAEFYRFKECCKKELGEEFDLVDYKDETEYNYTFPRMRLKNTTYLIISEISRHGRSAGFFIDIIIMDYVPQNRFKAFVQRRALMALHRAVSPGFLQSGIGLNMFERIGVGLSVRILGRNRTIQLAEKLIYTKDTRHCKKLIAEIFLPSVDYFYLYDRYHFDSSAGVPFEDTVLQVPVDPISLLHKCYFKRYIENHILLDYQYKNEIQAIQNKINVQMDDIMYIPLERSRDRHLEVVFDSMHDSKYYDDVIFQEMDKKKNDKAAIIDRKLREKDRTATMVMKHSEMAAKRACAQRLLYDFMKNCMEKYPYPESVSLEVAENILECVLEVLPDDLSKIDGSILVYILILSVRTGKTAFAKRLALVIKNFYPEFNIDKEIIILEAQSKAFSAVFQEKIDEIKAYIELGQEDLFTMTMKGICFYLKKEYAEAEKQFKECISICDSIFWTHYYLGMIEWKVKNNKEKADKLFCEALDDTNFMPQIQLALDNIEEIRHVSSQ